MEKTFTRTKSKPKPGKTGSGVSLDAATRGIIERVSQERHFDNRSLALRTIVHEWDAFQPCEHPTQLVLLTYPSKSETRAPQTARYCPTCRKLWAVD